MASKCESLWAGTPLFNQLLNIVTITNTLSLHKIGESMNYFLIRDQLSDLFFVCMLVSDLGIPISTVPFHFKNECALQYLRFLH